VTLLLLLASRPLGAGGEGAVVAVFFLAYFSRKGSEGRGEAVEGRPGEMGEPFVRLLLLPPPT
jgi:hypothetical protein